MKRRVITLATLLILVISIVSVNVLATTKNYSTNARQQKGSATNGPYSYQTAYGKLIPSTGVAILQICNAAGTSVHVQGTYPVYPQNPNRTEYEISPSETVTFYVKPANAGENISGTIVYGID